MNLNLEIMKILWVTFKILIFVIVLLVLVLFITRKTGTKQFTDSSGYTIKGSIAQEEYVKLGGIKQWVLMRGLDKEKPVLLFLHGGPCVSEHALFRYYNSELENHFVVVGWDQRGTGKSYTKLVPEEMKIENFVSDLHELVEYLKLKFKKDKIYLLGKSWGSLLGTLYAQKHPENIAAYLGTGQVTDQAQSELLGYNFVIEQAELRKNKHALQELKKIKSPPGKNAGDVVIQRKWLIKFGGHIYGRSGFILHWFPKMLSTSEYSWPDIISLVRALKPSLDVMWPGIYHTDLFKQVPQLEVPVYFLIGRHDYCTSSVLAEQYLDGLKAPFKKLIWFENSGHNPPFEESEKFNEAVIAILTDQNKKSD